MCARLFFLVFFYRIVLDCTALYLKWSHELTLVLLPGRWNWTAKHWWWWMIKHSQTLEEAACPRPNICSCLLTRWPFSSSQMPEPQAASDLWPLPHGLYRWHVYKAAHHWTEVTWTVVLFAVIFPKIKIGFFSYDCCWAVLFMGLSLYLTNLFKGSEISRLSSNVNMKQTLT